MNAGDLELRAVIEATSAAALMKDVSVEIARILSQLPPRLNKKRTDDLRSELAEAARRVHEASTALAAELDSRKPDLESLSIKGQLAGRALKFLKIAAMVGATTGGLGPMISSITDLADRAAMVEIHLVNLDSLCQDQASGAGGQSDRQSEQALLRQLAEHDLPAVRVEAVRRLDDQNLIASLSHDVDEMVRLESVRRLEDQARLGDLAGDPNSEVRREAAHRVADTQLLLKLTGSLDPIVRLEVARRLDLNSLMTLVQTDDSFRSPLETLADDPDITVREALGRRFNADGLLAEAAGKQIGKIRLLALQRLGRTSEQRENDE